MKHLIFMLKLYLLITLGKKCIFFIYLNIIILFKLNDLIKENLNKIFFLFII